MTVAEERRGSKERVAGSNSDQFPVGMRVLAVDDDPTCLKLLESLLLRCQYHVTTTNQAIVALEMLRENRDRFDLVISDVHMPDMDGFKLLELVGLEMDLPVIMLSGNGETQAVMKGISHGACDYLLKPVRIEELKNIWQHVVRRGKLEARDHNNSDDGEDKERTQAVNSEAGQDSASATSDRDKKLNRKRKDQNEDGEDGSDDSAHEDEDPSSQKKQRVVWSIELHRKFVAAVNYLGIDKAVPKKILDLMNVEKLTRENVASHLQKYRIFLKKANAMASRQANLVAALRGRNPGYLPVGSLEGLRNFHPLAASRQLPAFTSFQTNGLIGTMNKPIGFGQQVIRPSITVQQGDNYNIRNNHANDLRRLEGTGLMGNSHGNLLHGMPVPLELDRPQQHQSLQQTSNPFPAGLSTTGLGIGHSRKTLANVTNSTTQVSANQQPTAFGVLGNVSSAKVTPLNSDPFKMSSGNSCYLPDPGRCSESWQAAVPSANYSANASSAAAPLTQNIMPSSNSISSVAQTTTHMDRYVHGVSSINLAMEPLSQTVPGDDVQHQACMLDGNGVLLRSGVDENLGFLNNIEPRWESHEEILRYRPSLISACPLTLPNHVTSSIPENQGLNSGSLHEKINGSMISQNYGAPFGTQDCKAENQQNREYALDSGKLHDGLSSSGCSLDDLVNGANKLEPDDVAFFDGDFVSDFCSLGTFM